MNAELNLLFKRIAKGDEKAFREVFDKWYEPLFNNALAYTKLNESASDVVQQVFLELWERKEILVEVQDAEAWLYSAARFQAFYQLKKQTRHDSYLQNAIRIINENTVQTPEQKLMAAQTEQLVARTLAGLTEKQRDAYRLSRYEDMTYQQIGELWGVSVSTIKEHVAKAVKAIREQLTAQNNGLISLLINFLLFFF